MRGIGYQGPQLSLFSLQNCVGEQFGKTFLKCQTIIEISYYSPYSAELDSRYTFLKALSICLDVLWSIRYTTKWGGRALNNYLDRVSNEIINHILWIWTLQILLTKETRSLNEVKSRRIDCRSLREVDGLNSRYVGVFVNNAAFRNLSLWHNPFSLFFFRRKPVHSLWITFRLSFFLEFRMSAFSNVHALRVFLWQARRIFSGSAAHHFAKPRHLCLDLEPECPAADLVRSSATDQSHI